MEPVARILDRVVDGQADCPIPDCPAVLDAMHAWNASIAKLPAATHGHLKDAMGHCRACGGSCEVFEAIQTALKTMEAQRAPDTPTSTWRMSEAKGMRRRPDPEPVGGR